MKVAAKSVFSERLKAEREKKGQTQEQFARSLTSIYGISTSRGSISFYEKGERSADIEFIAAVADYCQVSADYLLGLSSIESVIPTLQSACSYTGLSEQTIRFFHIHKDEKINKDEHAVLISDTINYFICHSCFIDFIRLMACSNLSFQTENTCADSHPSFTAIITNPISKENPEIFFSPGESISIVFRSNAKERISSIVDDTLTKMEIDFLGANDIPYISNKKKYDKEKSGESSGNSETEG